MNLTQKIAAYSTLSLALLTGCKKAKVDYPSLDQLRETPYSIIKDLDGDGDLDAIIANDSTVFYRNEGNNLSLKLIKIVTKDNFANSQTEEQRMEAERYSIINNFFLLAIIGAFPIAFVIAYTTHKKGREDYDVDLGGPI